MSNNSNDNDNNNTNRKRERACPYLDTINRKRLDFDFERSCSVSLQSGPHIYCCLVCGKFFRGRGMNTPAFLHSVDENHCVFLHLSTGKFYCLPDNYEIVDSSLSDISAALSPTYTSQEIAKIDENTTSYRDLFGKHYLPGYVGLNNLKKTDYVNAVVQALVHVPPVRDYFLQVGVTIELPSPEKNQYSHLSSCFGELVRKIWSNKRFKSNVDPHEFIQAVSVASKKKFHIGKQADAGEFLSWLINCLHIGIGGSRKPGSSVIQTTFQGLIEVTSRHRKHKDLDKLLKKNDADDRYGSDDEEEIKRKEEENKKLIEDANKFEVEERTNRVNFLQLTLDIPAKPLFKDDEGGLVIPQEPLFNILQKFNGQSFSDVIQKGTPQKRRYKIIKLPNYLILHLGRFKKNTFTTEKNPTIVKFPVKNLDLKEYVFPDGGRPKIPSEDEVKSMSIKDLKSLLETHGRSDIAESAVEKKDLVDACLNFVTKNLSQLLAEKYDLVSNIVHDSPVEVGKEGLRDPLEEGSYRCHIQHKESGKWYEFQDLSVRETMAQLVGISESYILIFERKGGV